MSGPSTSASISRSNAGTKSRTKKNRGRDQKEKEQGPGFIHYIDTSFDAPPTACLGRSASWKQRTAPFRRIGLNRLITTLAGDEVGVVAVAATTDRSEERRVGKECR